MSKNSDKKGVGVSRPKKAGSGSTLQSSPKKAKDFRSDPSRKEAVISDGMTVRERYALEFAKILLQSDLKRAIKSDELSRSEGGDGREEELVISDFYYAACTAANMADDLAVALNDQTPGHRHKEDEDRDYSLCGPGVKESIIADSERSVAAAVSASVRQVVALAKGIAAAPRSAKREEYSGKPGAQHSPKPNKDDE